MPRQRPRKAPLASSFAAAAAALGEGAVRHVVSFSWLGGAIWVRTYRIDSSEADPRQSDINEIGPRLVLRPVRIVAEGLGGAVLARA